ncbi:Uu.00g020820.m01.CDS01 [Anthostomella pinea]|uniref:Uu.00g020820.m01.CDS01 n=1 Tax=Anthostomella pinea TaxID=933095 RepID=A0AAI8W0S0_9PEZI|nr:Uu.00g020820.m01.CDS01 [Anthostomella pinea]
MSDDTKRARVGLYRSLNFAGTSDWAIDMQILTEDDGCPAGTCDQPGVLYVGPVIYTEINPVVTCSPPCQLILPPFILPTPTTFDFPPCVEMMYRKLSPSTSYFNRQVFSPGLETHADNVTQAIETDSASELEVVDSNASDVADDELDDNSADESDHENSPVWNSQLPRFAAPSKLVKGGEDGSSVFDLRKLIGAVQAGETAENVRDYIGHYDKDTRRENLNAVVEGYPAIFYVVETNNVEMIRHWIKYGGSPNATFGDDSFPLIAYAILRGARTEGQASNTLKTLLRLGADPRVIPEAFYAPYCRELPKDGPCETELHDITHRNKLWCIPSVHPHLVRSLNLTQRYDLHRARIPLPSARERDLVVRQDAEEILGVNQTIIAQSIAARWLKKKMLVKPLVLVFAGPSGHGKTELAQKFGEMMSLEMHKVDCTIFSQENELFGPRKPFQGWEEGSPLNSFIAQKSGSRHIIFMDEFEKTSEAIHNTLLLPFQDGQYEDRRNGKIMSCAKTIWILATNKLDASIHEFCTKNEEALFHSGKEQTQDKLVEKLCKTLRKEFIGHFKAPLAGRITEIIPFLTFAPDEAAVVAHKVFMDFESEVAKSVVLSANKDDDRYIGNVRIQLKNDATIFSRIAQEDYMKKLGARSIASAVDRTICDPLTTLYLREGDEEFREDQDESSFVVGLNADTDVEVQLKPRAFDEEETY